MARDDPHFRLRVPADLRDRIAANAKRNKRSINAEIVERLEAAYPAPPDIDEAIADIKTQIGFLKKFRHLGTLANLADSLDFLIIDIAKTPSLSPEDRKAAKEFAEQHGVFNRVPPVPDEG